MEAARPPINVRHPRPKCFKDLIYDEPRFKVKITVEFEPKEREVHKEEVLDFLTSKDPGNGHGVMEDFKWIQYIKDYKNVQSTLGSQRSTRTTG